ncbi:MAG: hypothetical protein FJ011_23130 [Chloroflexi bacterium]|nr:hypothetical protein [Chloroflexota bacterium]
MTETYRFTAPADARGPLTIQVRLNYRAAAGYLTALMTIYQGAEVPAAPVGRNGRGRDARTGL